MTNAGRMKKIGKGLMSKTALITGASRGIGRAVAKRFGAAGYELFLISKRSVEDMKDLPGHHYAGDVGDFDFVKSVAEDMGRADVLVNNAGIAYFGLFQEMEPEEWDRIIRTNLTSVYNTCRCIVPKMVRAHSGKIINVSSQWGNVGASMEVAYSASKGGINALTKALAKELAPSNIQVNAVALGVIDTDMNARFDGEEKEELIASIPAGRMGSAAEAAELIYSLAGDNEYLTGQIIGLDGGWI